MKTVKRVLSILIAVIMMITSIPFTGFKLTVSAASFNDINQNSVFLKQAPDTSTCTLVAATNMIRRTSLLRGDSNWSSITESKAREVGWIYNQGLRGSFTYSNEVSSISVTSASLPGNSSNTSTLINILASHPEGIVIYNGTHAVLLTDYTGGVFYCNDPDDKQPVGRVEASRAYSVRPTNATKYWYVSSPSVSLGGSSGVPVIITKTFENVSTSGYDAVLVFDKVYNVTLADFIVWTDKNGQDDIKSAIGTISGNTVRVRINSSDHNNETGKYITHVYLYYNGGSQTLGVAFPDITLSDTTKPQVSNLKIINVTKTGYDAVCNVSDTESGILKADFVVWSEKNGQDDMLCKTGEIKGNTASFHVNISDHKNDSGKYNTHIYIYDSAGNSASGTFPITDLSETNPPKISNLKITNVTQNGYTVTCTAEDESGISFADFMAWSINNGQDDMNENHATISGNTITAYIKASDHGNDIGEYMTHVYVYDGLKNVSSMAFPKVNLSGYNISYVCNNDIEGFENQKKIYDEKISLSTEIPKKQNYYFIEWNTNPDGTGTSYLPGEMYSSNQDLLLYAIWGAGKYNIYYNANGGSCSTASKSVTYNSTYGTLPTPTRTGYTFDGWYTSSSGGTKITADTKVSITADQTLYAHWTANANTAYKVNHYQMNVSGSGYTLKETESKTGTTASSVTIANLKKTYSGFTYEGGKGATAGTTTKPSMLDTTTTILADGTRVINIYYSRNKYALTLSKGTGISSVSGAGTYYYGQSVSIDAAVSTGYTWSKWSDGNTTKARTYTMPAAATTLTASATATNYTISYNLDGGSVATANPTSYNITTADFTLNNPTKTGYTFAGWTGTGLSAAAKTVTVAKGSTGNRSYTATWTINEITVTFNANGGKCSTASKTVTYESTYGTLPSPSARKGYVFTGWYDSMTGGTQITADTNVITEENHTLYAHWEHDTFAAKSSSTIVIGNSFVFGESLVGMTGNELSRQFSNTNVAIMMFSSRASTGDTINLIDDKNMIYETRTVVIFGDVNGDGWYDGMDSMIVSCIANGMLTKDDVGEAVYTAADCNHDGVIDQLDVDILNQAGVILADVDQSKSEEELLETSSAYAEYLNLIDQTVETETTEVVEDEPVDPGYTFNFFDMILKLIKEIITVIKSAIEFFK